jgi:hypothetical protein
MLVNEFWKRMSVCAFIASRNVGNIDESEYCEHIAKIARERKLFFGGDPKKDKVILAIKDMVSTQMISPDFDSIAKLLESGVTAWEHYQKEEVAYQCKQDLSQGVASVGVTERGQFRM